MQQQGWVTVGATIWNLHAMRQIGIAKDAARILSSLSRIAWLTPISDVSVVSVSRRMFASRRQERFHALAMRGTKRAYPQGVSFRQSFRGGMGRLTDPLILLVGVRGFEPPTPSSRTRCATRLRYTPTTPSPRPRAL